MILSPNVGDKSPDDSSVLGSVVYSSEVNKEVWQDICGLNGFLG